MRKYRLLLVDDAVEELESRRRFLEAHGYAVDAVTCGEKALELFSANPLAYALILADYHMPHMDGAALAEKLMALQPDVYVLILSGDESRESVMDSTRRGGARAYIDKSEDPLLLLHEITKWCLRAESRYEQKQTPENACENVKKIHEIGMIGCSQALAHVARRVTQLRYRHGPVLILGESGTGKERVAQALHDGSASKFFAINCARFKTNPQLLTSLLFGHTKGAFTGADAYKKGLFEEARGGTVFLDEIHELPISCQVALLRAIEQKKVRPVGSLFEIAVNFRLVSAAKPMIHAAVVSGEFKLDLFHRINQSIISLPDLQERPEDIEPLVRYFIEEWNSQNKAYKKIHKTALAYLQAYDWPGNVRELQNTLFGILDTLESDAICPSDLDERFLKKGPSASVYSLREYTDRAEREHLIRILKISHSFRDAARKMNVSQPTVLRLMKKHRLDGTALIQKRAGEKGDP